MDINTYVTPWLGKTAKLMTASVIDYFKMQGIDITIEQFILLKFLNDEDGQIQNDLAFITHRDKTSLTRLINTLEKKGFVKRASSKEDKRIKRIYITPIGIDKFKSMLPIMKLFFEKIQQGFSEDEISFLITAFKRIQKNIEYESK